MRRRQNGLLRISAQWLALKSPSIGLMANRTHVNENLDHGFTEEKVNYLPQTFVEDICSPENHQDLVREMERVIFQRIPRTDRMGLTMNSIVGRDAGYFHASLSRIALRAR